jgi:hypothetical protein
VQVVALTYLVGCWLDKRLVAMRGWMSRWVARLLVAQVLKGACSASPRLMETVTAALVGQEKAFVVEDPPAWLD